jgi:hypothetical protein
VATLSRRGSPCQGSSPSRVANCGNFAQGEAPQSFWLFGDNPAPMTFDEALAALLALVRERVDVHVMDAGEIPHLVATFGGRLEAGYSMTGGEPSDTEAIFVRLDAGQETAAISLTARSFRPELLTRTERSRSSSAAWSS